ncbi:MAG: hypothetical protein ACM3PE_09030 [Deltaproteobacteria bacterium]
MKNEIDVQNLLINTELPKVCWLIDKNDLNMFDEIVKINYSILGGLTYLIIPIFNNIIESMWIGFFKAYEPDIIITCEEANDELLQQIKTICNPIRFINGIEEGKSILLEKNGVRSNNENAVIEYFKPDINSNYKKLFEKIFPYEEIARISGCIPVQKYDSLEFLLKNNVQEIMLEDVSVSMTIASSMVQDEYPELIKMQKLLSSIEGFPYSRIDADYFIERFVLLDSFNIIIGDLESIQDLCLFWNTYFILRYSTVWIPKDEIKNEILIKDLINGLSIRKETYNWKNINILSSSLDSKNIKELTKLLNQIFRELYSSHYSLFFNPTRPYAFLCLSLKLNDFMQNVIFNNNKATLIPIIPDNLKKDYRYHHKVLIYALSYYQGILPQDNNLTKLICDQKEAGFSKNGLRLITDGNPIHLIQPDAFEVIEYIFKQKGFTIKISDKGWIARRTINLLGSIEECSIFKNQNIKNLLTTLTKNSSAPVSSDTIKNIFPENHNKDVEDLITKKIIFRGYQLKCKYCSSENWVSIDTAKEINTCSGCLAEIKLPLDAQPLYKLNSLIAHAHSQGVITQLYTILNLPENNTKTFLPGVIIQELNREVDLVAIYKNGITIGECKNDGRQLHNAEVDSIIHLANLLEVKEIVFGSMVASFTKTIKNKYQNDKRILFIE